MLPPQSPGPFERPEQLAEALREQGVAPEELANLVPAVHRLSEWQAPRPSPADTQRLLVQLARALPALSPVRQAIRAHRQRQGAGVRWLLATARIQVSLFGPAFWLVSALVTLLGAGVVLSKVLPDQGLLLRASGPFLAYLGTSIAFRGTTARALECELVCPPSPVQLALARLVVVLGYDVALGLALSLVLWVGGTEQVAALMLSWFMPLLLVAGLALALSLRLSIQVAASLAYGGWLAALAMDANVNLPLLRLTPATDALLGGIGLALLAVALLRLPTDMPRLLPSP
jgi:hypothetical protein